MTTTTTATILLVVKLEKEGDDDYNKKQCGTIASTQREYSWPCKLDKKDEGLYLL